MSWWAWLIIWGGLVLALLVMLALSAWWLFRKFLVLTDDVASLAESAAVLETEEYEHVRPAIAVLADIRDINAREQARQFHRAERRRLRHDRRIARARRIVGLDASTRVWPTEWYGK